MATPTFEDGSRVECVETPRTGQDHAWLGLVGTVEETTSSGFVRVRPDNPDDFRLSMFGDTVLLRLDSLKQIPPK